MASENKRVISLGLDYSQFNGGITDCTNKMKLLDAEFRLASEQMKLNGSNADQLKLKQEKLTQSIYLQAQKVEEAKKQYDTMVASGNRTERQLDSMRIALLNQETALARMQNELSSVNNELEETSETTKSFGDNIRGMASTLGLEVSPAVEGLASKFDGMDASVGNAIIGIGAIATAFIGCTLSAANFADDLLTLSSVTSISTDELQRLQYASNFVDVDVSTLTGSMKKLTQNMDNARGGSKELQEAFGKLRVKYKENNGELKDVNDVFYNTIDALGKVRNETERDALAMSILGKSATELNPLIEAGSERLKELGIEAENMGTVISEDSLGKLGQLKDAMDKMDTTTDSLKTQLGLVLLPILTSLFEAISAIPVPVLKTLIVLASAVAGVMLVVKAIKSMTDTGKAIKGFFSGFDASTLKTTAIVLGVVGALIALAAIIAVIMGKGNELNGAMSSIGDNMSKVTGTVQQVQNNVRTVSSNASGVRNFKGGLTWINEGKPELVELPKGSNIYNGEETARMFGGDTYQITMVVEANKIDEVQKLINMVNSQQQANRRGAHSV